MSQLNDFNQRIIEEFRSNGGKVSGQFANAPLLLLTTIGAKTGRSLTKPLAYTTDGGKIVIIASYAGAPKNPAWFNNIVANPVVTVELGTERYQARSKIVTGAERQRLYDNQAKQMAIFADYQKKTTREIPVVVLERIS
jgi:deazaflavin-dependent oxidoreductase (nitroreductase family)